MPRVSSQRRKSPKVLRQHNWLLAGELLTYIRRRPAVDQVPASHQRYVETRRNRWTSGGTPMRLGRAVRSSSGDSPTIAISCGPEAIVSATASARPAKRGPRAQAGRGRQRLACRELMPGRSGHAASGQRLGRERSRRTGWRCRKGPSAARPAPRRRRRCRRRCHRQRSARAPGPAGPARSARDVAGTPGDTEGLRQRGVILQHAKGGRDGHRGRSGRAGPRRGGRRGTIGRVDRGLDVRGLFEASPRPG